MENITTWLIANAVYGFLCFCAFMGALFWFLNSDAHGLTTVQRLFSILTTVLMVSIVAIYVVKERDWSIYASGGAAFGWGVVVDKILRVLVSETSSWATLSGIFSTITQTAKDFWAAYRAVKNKDDEQ